MSSLGRNLIRSAKNYTRGYTNIQIKVRSVTSNSSLSPCGSLMSEISEATHDPHRVIEILEIIHKRLNDSGKNWRHVFKSLLLLDYLLRTGSETIVLYAQSNIYIIKTLRYFEHIDDSGLDQGANVRQKSKDITALLESRDRLNTERELHRKISPGSMQNLSSSPGYPMGNQEERDLHKVMDESKKSYYRDMHDRDKDLDDHSLRFAIELSKQEAEQAKRDAEKSAESVAQANDNSLELDSKLAMQKLEQMKLYQRLLSQQNSLLSQNIGKDLAPYEAPRPEVPPPDMEASWGRLPDMGASWGRPPEMGALWDGQKSLPDRGASWDGKGSLLGLYPATQTVNRPLQLSQNIPQNLWGAQVSGILQGAHVSEKSVKDVYLDPFENLSKGVRSDEERPEYAKQSGQYAQPYEYQYTRPEVQDVLKKNAFLDSRGGTSFLPATANSPAQADLNMDTDVRSVAAKFPSILNMNTTPALPDSQANRTHLPDMQGSYPR